MIMGYLIVGERLDKREVITNVISFGAAICIIVVSKETPESHNQVYAISKVANALSAIFATL
jgi:hypothetical protein